MVIRAVGMAILQRSGGWSVIFRSDRGSQFRSSDYQRLLTQNTLLCSMSAVGHCDDNAACEGFFDVLKRECVSRMRIPSMDVANTDLFDYIERFHNPRMGWRVAKQDRIFSSFQTVRDVGVEPFYVASRRAQELSFSATTVPRMRVWRLTGSGGYRMLPSASRHPRASPANEADSLGHAHRTHPADCCPMTFQRPEILRSDSLEFAIQGEPLGNLFALGYAGPTMRIETTDCWRGYQGTWEFIDDRLYIVGLQGLIDNGDPASLADFFPEQPDRAFAHWYSGTLTVHEGERRRDTAGVYSRTCKVFTVLTVECGRVLGQREVREDNDGPDWELPYMGPVSYPEAIEAFTVRPADVCESLTVAEAEARERIDDPLGAVPPLPMGYLHKVWTRFVTALGPDDRLFRFEARYVDHCGVARLRCGYTARLDGAPNAYIITGASSVPWQNPRWLGQHSKATGDNGSSLRAC